MAEEKKHDNGLTAEEKLQRAIQNNASDANKSAVLSGVGSSATAAAMNKTDAVEAETRPQGVERQGQKSRLKLADTAQEPAVFGAAAGERPRVAMLGRAESGPVGGKAVAAGKSGLRQANRAAFVGIVILLMMAGYEIFAGIRYTVPDLAVETALAGAGDKVATNGVVYSWEDLAKRISIKPFFAKNGAEPVVQGATSGPQVVFDQLKLMGLSQVKGSGEEAEAILLDKKTGSMHFLKVGSKFSLTEGGSEWALEEIQDDFVVLNDGGRKIRVE